MVVGPVVNLNTDNNPTVKYMLKLREEHAGKQEKDYSHVFRIKSRFDLVRLSFIIIGIEFAYAAETAFVSPILLQIGLEHKHMTLVWGLSPIFGFILAPLLGSLSDRCRLRLGRRRPIIILLAICTFGGLCLVPFGKELGQLLGDGLSTENLSYEITSNVTESTALPTILSSSYTNNYKIATLLTILGIVLLDFSAETCQAPARGYLLDICIPEDHAKGLSTFSVLAGLGGTFGYILGGINWKETVIGSFFGGNIPTVFMIVIVIFIISVFITTTSFKEIPLELMEKDNLLRPLSAIEIQKEMTKNVNVNHDVSQNSIVDLKVTFQEKQIEESTIKSNVDNNKSISEEIDQKMSFLLYLKSIVVMPKSMRILCLTNLLSWMGYICYCLYFTDFVGETVFGGNPSAPHDSPEYLLYEEGVRFGCWGMSIFAFSCSIYSISVERLLHFLRLKTIYVGGILIFAVGMLVLSLWPTKIGVLVLSSTAGIIYGTVFTMPFMLVAKYHAQGTFEVKNGESVVLKQSRGLGTDIAIINSMLFVAQLIISLSLGSLISFLNTTTAVLYAASAIGVCAAISAMNVLYI